MLSNSTLSTMSMLTPCFFSDFVSDTEGDERRETRDERRETRDERRERISRKLPGIILAKLQSQTGEKQIKLWSQIAISNSRNTNAALPLT